MSGLIGCVDSVNTFLLELARTASYRAVFPQELATSLCLQGQESG